ncbi:MAG: hypothetical protein LQ344_001592 [Seirophora lacunosa]|nr:MAG: hypothetical protein LQ344_001592 [Seirophora lacunosa]
MDPSADSLMPASIAFATLDPRADSLTPASIAFPTLAIIAIVLGIPPLVWHATNRNLAACNLISWTILVNLCSFVNALIWPTDNITTWFAGYVLCDIEAKILLAASVGIAGSLACIMRALAKVLDTENTRMIPTKKQRYQELVIIALLCFGTPIYMILIHYVVQPSRYYIMAIAGCTTSLDNSWPALVLVVIWSPVLCLVAVYYAMVVLIRMRKYRRDFSSILSASNSNLTRSRFLRIFLLSSLLILIFLPSQLYELYRNASHPLLPYSWDLIHTPSSWGNIIMVPQHGVVPLDRWMPIILGILIFVFFGMGSDATRMYRKWWLKLRPGTNSPGPYGQPAASRIRSSNLGQEKGSLASLLSEKHHTATTITTQASPVESEKMSRAQDPALMTSPTNTSHSNSLAREDRPLPPVPAQSKPFWLGNYFSRARNPSASGDMDIESAMERYDNHRPNRFIAGLWHANNAGNSAPVPATQMGNCNGLRV